MASKWISDQLWDSISYPAFSCIFTLYRKILLSVACPILLQLNFISSNQCDWTSWIGVSCCGIDCNWCMTAVLFFRTYMLPRLFNVSSIVALVCFTDFFVVWCLCSIYLFSIHVKYLNRTSLFWLLFHPYRRSYTSSLNKHWWTLDI